MSRENLPGESARASLKRFPIRCGAMACAQSPGRIGPGLIEAGSVRTAVIRELPQSPGRIGPGLIEAR